MTEFKTYCKKEGATYIVVREKGVKEEGLPILYKNMFIFKSLSYEDKTKINKFCIMLFELLSLHVRQEMDKTEILKIFIGELTAESKLKHLKFKK